MLFICNILMTFIFKKIKFDLKYKVVVNHIPISTKISTLTTFRINTKIKFIKFCLIFLKINFFL